MSTENKNPLEMSDEEFLNVPVPDADQEPDDASIEEPVVKQEEKQEEIPPNNEPVVEATPKEEAPANVEEPKPDTVTEPEPKTETEPVVAPTVEGEDKNPKPEVKEEPKVEAPLEPVNYENSYKQIMAPFKANGKMIELKSPEEAIALMQMGANYTKKMQELQPQKKLLLMLQNNGLLDEGKLTYLIDLDKKNPEAIKKLIKDSGIDPLDIDTNIEPDYRQGNHTVSDQEVLFSSKLEELTSAPTGKETLQIIDTQWDDTSKNALWEDPNILSVIQEQRESGVYDIITAEMDRQKLLGKISPNTPFLKAYTAVGDQLTAAAQTEANANAVANQPKPEPKVVTVREAAPKSEVVNNDRASAASPTRSSAGEVKQKINFLSMTDDEFLKSMDGRL